MVTISCSCGAVATGRRNPFRGLDLPARRALLADALGVEDGFVCVELDAAWHPDADLADEACVLVADLDEIDATEGLPEPEAAELRALLGGAWVRGARLPLEVVGDGARFRVRPGTGHGPGVVLQVDEGDEVLVEIDARPEDVALLPELVELHRRGGAEALRRVARRAHREPLALLLRDRAVAAA